MCSRGDRSPTEGRQELSRPRPKRRLPAGETPRRARPQVPRRGLFAVAAACGDPEKYQRPYHGSDHREPAGVAHGPTASAQLRVRRLIAYQQMYQALYRGPYHDPYHRPYRELYHESYRGGPLAETALTRARWERVTPLSEPLIAPSRIAGFRGCCGAGSVRVRARLQPHPPNTRISGPNRSAPTTISAAILA